MYQGQAPWDTGRPQPSIIKLAESGQIRGSVLDVGCGTGENLLYLAAKGHEAWGLDFVPVAIERAKAKAAQRGINAHFIVGNALELKKLGRQFDTVIDCGLFHPSLTRNALRSSRGLPMCFGLGDRSTSSVSRTKNREPRGQGESASRKSGIPSMTAGPFSELNRLSSNRFQGRMFQSLPLVARKHGWQRLTGSEFEGKDIV